MQKKMDHNNMQDENIKLFFEKISNSDKILLITHRHPDGDALGSILSMQNVLISLNKDVVSFCIDKISENFNYLEGAQKLESNVEKLEATYDLCIMLDCADLYMTKIDEKLKTINFKFGTINIDHHFTNPGLSDLNIVIKDASSTSEIVYKIFKELKINITPSVATCLLTGIITDTGNFTNNATTKESIEIASKLLQIGADFSQILEANIYNKTINILKLWGIVLKRIVYNKELGMVVTAVFDKDLKNFGLDNEASEGISNYLNSLSKDIKFSILLKDNDNGFVKGSLRTTRDDVDVAQVALAFNGGGHKKAAGFEIPGHLEFKNDMWKIVR